MILTRFLILLEPRKIENNKQNIVFDNRLLFSLLTLRVRSVHIWGAR